MQSSAAPPQVSGPSATDPHNAEAVAVDADASAHRLHSHFACSAMPECCSHNHSERAQCWASRAPSFGSGSCPEHFAGPAIPAESCFCCAWRLQRRPLAVAAAPLASDWDAKRLAAFEGHRERIAVAGDRRPLSDHRQPSWGCSRMRRRHDADATLAAWDVLLVENEGAALFCESRNIFFCR